MGNFSVATKAWIMYPTLESEVSRSHYDRESVGYDDQDSLLLWETVCYCKNPGRCSKSGMGKHLNHF